MLKKMWLKIIYRKQVATAKVPLPCRCTAMGIQINHNMVMIFLLTIVFREFVDRIETFCHPWQKGQKQVKTILRRYPSCSPTDDYCRLPATGEDTAQVIEVLFRDTNDERKSERTIDEAGATIRCRPKRWPNQLRVTKPQRNTTARLNDEADTKQTPAEPNL